MRRVTDLADPNRCQAPSKDGQCRNYAEHGSDYCKYHQGVSTKDQDDIRSYLVAQADVKRRLAQLDSQQDPIRDLQRTISVTHILIERCLDACETNTDLMAASGPLLAMIQRMESLQKTVVSVQEKLDELLPRAAVLELGHAIQTVIIDELSHLDGYEEIVDRIIDRIYSDVTNKQKVLEAPKNVEFPGQDG